HPTPGASLSRRAFMFLAGLATLALGRPRSVAAADPAEAGAPLAAAVAGAGEWDAALEEALRFPLFSALFGRRSRRFGWGMEIPRGPLAFRSEKPPTPLDDLERSLLIAAGLGVSGWHFGIPY